MRDAEKSSERRERRRREDAKVDRCVADVDVGVDVGVGEADPEVWVLPEISGFELSWKRLCGKVVPQEISKTF